MIYYRDFLQVLDWDHSSNTAIYIIKCWTQVGIPSRRKGLNVIMHFRWFGIYTTFRKRKEWGETEKAEANFNS